MEKKCNDWFPKHEFGKWKVFGIKKGKFVSTDNISVTVFTGNKVYQKRECSSCGLTQFLKEDIY